MSTLGHISIAFIDVPNTEEMNALAEDFMYTLYDVVSPILAKRFVAPTEHSDEQVAALVAEAKSHGFDISREDLLAPNPAADQAARRIAWQNTARAATLSLLDSLVKLADSGVVAISAEEWAEHCNATLDFSDFNEQTGLVEEEARAAVKEAAKAIIAYEGLTSPQTLLFGGRGIVLFTT